MVHRFNIFLLSIALVIAQVITMNQALASNVGGWSLGGGVAQGASTVYTGTKNIIINGADYVKKGTAIVTPTATGVAKVLAKGVAGVALSVAVEQLLGAVDWVLDPANNQIVYSTNDPTKPVDPEAPEYQYFYSCIANFAYVCGYKYYSNPEAVAKLFESENETLVKCSKPSYNVVTCTFSSGWTLPVDRIVNTAYDPTAEKPDEDKKTLPLDTVAQKVISNAESGDTNAQVATGAAAADIVAEAETDQSGAKARPIAQQLESSASTKPADEAAADKANEATGEQTKNPDKPDTTDLKLTFPIFCNWAPTVCQAAQTVITFPTTLTEWWETGKEKAEIWATSISQAWTEAKEWMTEKEKPEQETVVDIDKTIPVVPNTSYFNWGAYCPFSPGSQTISLENTSAGIDYDLTSWCELASDIRPFVLAAGALMSFLIAAGVVMGRDD